MRLTRHTRPSDPVLESAILCGFSFVPDAPGFHESYFSWCEMNNRPYVTAWTVPTPGVIVNMNTCDWVLDLRSRDRANRLLRAAEGSSVHVDPRIVESDGLDAGRVRTLAFRLWEIAQDSMPTEAMP